MIKIKETIEKTAGIARIAGDLLRQGWGHATRVEYKGDVDLVTDYDRKAESIITDALQTEFPGHHIYAEEQGDVGLASSPYTWLVDPLDGTTNFAHGFPVFAVSIGLTHRGERLIGVIYDPIRDELFTAGAGSGAHLNGNSIQVSQVESLDHALLSTGFAYNRASAADRNLPYLDQFLRHSQGIRRAGAAALDLAYIACGRLDGHWEMCLHPWDVAAGILIITQAGGRVTDFSGGHKFDHTGREIVASNGQIHNAMLAILGPGHVVR
ncbi:MAG: inositol monophosphatase [Anaerolineae bacterium]|nr:inositol monophosphatase [Anaerolineae bacterium]